VRYCVSLGAKVTARSNVGRVVGNNGGTLTGNRARSDMRIGTRNSEATVTGGTGTNANGIAHSTGTANSTVFQNFSTSSAWNNIPSGNLTVGGALPTFKDKK